MRISRKILAAFVFIMILVCAGCSRKSSGKADDDGRWMYGIDVDEIELERFKYKTKAEDTEEDISRTLKDLEEMPVKKGSLNPLPADVELQGAEICDGVLTLDFSDDYYNMGSTREVLCRGAYVLTLMQIQGVDGVEFTVNNKPLEYSTGGEVGVMTEDTFVDGGTVLLEAE